MNMPAQHTWGSARDLVGKEQPSIDDVPTTVAGERLDTADKVRDFLARVADARSA